ncbi:hypothetical protein RM445_31040 [Pseudonocardia sp. DSM 45834]|uniref:Uncharacterized protein n=1 Tax=Pseudonocardia charpentierae TaxID=3075545 RepID=A0ABU2NIX6_9PSEU|nr:hypothetical protein [Pseudonocardia sp. DSM 45834]
MQIESPSSAYNTVAPDQSSPHLRQIIAGRATPMTPFVTRGMAGSHQAEQIEAARDREIHDEYELYDPVLVFERHWATTMCSIV